MLDNLPLTGNGQSILRFDHLLAVGNAITNFELTDYKLSQEAIEIVLDWTQWLIEGDVPAESTLEIAKGELDEVNRIQ